MTKKIRTWVFRPLLPATALYLFETKLAPTVVDKYAQCQFTQHQEGYIAWTVHLWFSSKCTWEPYRARFILPSVFVVGLVLTLVIAQFIIDWHKGAPGWASDLAGFGLGAVMALGVFGAIGYGIAHAVDNYDKAHHHVTPKGDAGIVGTVLLIAAYVSLPIGAIWLWHRSAKLISSGLRHGRTGGPVALVGSIVGVLVGSGIAVALVWLALFALMIYALYMAMIIIFGAILAAAVASAFG